MNKYSITYYNIRSESEETEVIEAVSQYEAMVLICNKNHNNVVVSVKELSQEMENKN